MNPGLPPKKVNDYLYTHKTKIVTVGTSLGIVLLRNYLKVFGWDKDTKLFITVDLISKSLTISEVED